MTRSERRAALRDCATPGEVADCLRAAGVTGARNSLAANPISVYLGDPLCMVELTEAERAFLEEFDHGNEYADILDRGTAADDIGHAAHAILLALEDSSERGMLTMYQYGLLELAWLRLRTAHLELRGV
jgi:hypothetical protein